MPEVWGTRSLRDGAQAGWLALVVSRLMQQALFEVDPAEPLVCIALSITLLLIAEAASFIPARSATRIDPVIALRTD